MSKYHINSNTGNPGVCSAKKSCPFGDLTKDHYESKEAAREAFETAMAAGTIPSFVQDNLSEYEQEVLKAKVLKRAANRQKKIDQERSLRAAIEFMKQDSVAREKAKQTPKPPAEKTFTEHELNTKVNLIKLQAHIENLEQTDRTYYPNQAGSYGQYLARRGEVIEARKLLEEKMNKNSKLFTQQELRQAELDRWKAEVELEITKLTHYRRYEKKGRGIWGSKNDYDLPEENYKTVARNRIDSAPDWVSEDDKEELKDRLQV